MRHVHAMIVQLEQNRTNHFLDIILDAFHSFIHSSRFVVFYRTSQETPQIVVSNVFVNTKLEESRL